MPLTDMFYIFILRRQQLWDSFQSRNQFRSRILDWIRSRRLAGLFGWQSQVKYALSDFKYLSFQALCHVLCLHCF